MAQEDYERYQTVTEIGLRNLHDLLPEHRVILRKRDGSESGEHYEILDIWEDTAVIPENRRDADYVIQEFAWYEKGVEFRELERCDRGDYCFGPEDLEKVSDMIDSFEVIDFIPPLDLPYPRHLFTNHVDREGYGFGQQ